MKDDLDTLTPREREVLVCLSEGLSDRQIAEKLDMGWGTARTHVAHIRYKLHVHTRFAAGEIYRNTREEVNE